ncbi:hypothetical protein BGZ94_004464, partial [Podila epigama]
QLDLNIYETFLFRGKFDTAVLCTILSKNRGLKDVSLSFDHPLARCDGWKPLPWIEKLAFDTYNLKNGALQLLQHCPNITSLVLTLYLDCNWDDVYLAMGGAGGRAKLTYLKLRTPFKDIYGSDTDDPPDNKVLRILKATTALVTLELIFDDFVDESCQDNINYCSNTLQYLTLDICEVSMNTVSSVNKILQCCPELRRLSLSIHGRDFSQQWFQLFEPRWDAPKLESLKFKAEAKTRVIDYIGENHDLGDIRSQDMERWQQIQPRCLFSTLERLRNSYSQSFAVGFGSGSVPDIYDRGLELGLDTPTAEILIGVYEQFYERERQLIASIKDNGWCVSSDHSMLHTNLDLQHFRGLLLEQALTIPTLKTVCLNSIALVACEQQWMRNIK